MHFDGLLRGTCSGGKGSPLRILCFKFVSKNRYDSTQQQLIWHGVGDEVPSEIIRSQHIQNDINNKPKVELDRKKWNWCSLESTGVLCLIYCAAPVRLADTFDTA